MKDRGRVRARLAWAAAACLAHFGCANAEDLFREGRLLDPCDRSWPVCTTTAGCLLGNESYLEGRFPGMRRFVVRTEGPAEIDVVLFLRTQEATGSELRIVWNEARCGSQAVETVKGLDVFKQFEAEGELRRSRTVQQPGDHLVEVSCDATAEYLIKAEVREAVSHKP